MFSVLKSLWNESGITASVDGVLREARNGNAVEVQRWYFKLKKDSYKQALELGITPAEAELRALSTIEADKLEEYQSITLRFRKPGGVLAEIDDWLRSHDPI